MHWVWRVLIAAGISFAFLTGLRFAIMRLWGIQPFTVWPFALSLQLVAYLVPIALFAVLTRLFARQSPQDRETRCRQCRYILHGITEPRCPECGERI